MKIKIKYHPFPKLRWLSLSKQVNVATTWDKCSSKQLIALLYSKSEGATDARFVSMFYGLNYRLVSKLSKFDIYNLVEGATQISSSPFNGNFIIRSVQTHGRASILHPPGDRMRGITFGQFIFIDAYFNNPEPDSRLRFITHLYLPAGEKFNEDRCIERASQLDVTDDIIEAIMYNYSLFYEYFARAYPLLFHTSSGTDALQGVSNFKYDPRGWLKIYESIVGTDLINADRYADVPLNTMFRYLSDLRKQQLKNNNKNPN